jgi:hypothetical protein
MDLNFWTISIAGAFVVGLVLGFVLQDMIHVNHIESNVKAKLKKERMHIWVSAWRYCIFRVTDEWNNNVEAFAIRCAEDTFEDWHKTLEK